ncbi:hypothetical protein EYF80_055833 [Liparis tanakae]|uniref:Uncharacterized protein n=1 Tax=Liparis tanakae TaxID=230148 RepID=A0A4Z2EZQ4_9TELE|nr:hypothetical protein EYF80_055833 [Liparis tanakae]
MSGGEPGQYPEAAVQCCPPVLPPPLPSILRPSVCRPPGEPEAITGQQGCYGDQRCPRGATSARGVLVERSPSRVEAVSPEVTTLFSRSEKAPRRNRSFYYIRLKMVHFRSDVITHTLQLDTSRTFKKGPMQRWVLTETSRSRTARRREPVAAACRLVLFAAGLWASPPLFSALIPANHTFVFLHSSDWSGSC